MKIDKPFSFNDMIGQPKFLEGMKNRSKEIDFPHTMIFEGESGSGKSTSALIIAALLNCDNPIEHEDGTHSPCGVCSSCKDIKEERFQRDVYFLDASNMGKDDVIELDTIASGIPFHDKKRVIIIDEAQELSNKSFGATLKLLEKKRDNAYFIFCTMNVKSISQPIKDRGQTYKFWPVPEKLIAEYLFNFVKDDSSIPDEFIGNGLFLIASYANGSVRAALKYLSRCVDEHLLDTEDIERELGVISKDTLASLILKLLSGDPSFFAAMKSKEETIDDFFNKSWMALLEAKLYKAGGLNGLKIPDWKKKYNIKYLEYEKTIDKVLNIYEDVFEHSRYLKTDYFLTKLWNGVYAIPKTTRKEIPVQKIRKRLKANEVR